MHRCHLAPISCGKLCKPYMVFSRILDIIPNNYGLKVVSVAKHKITAKYFNNHVALLIYFLGSPIDFNWTRFQGECVESYSQTVLTNAMAAQRVLIIVQCLTNPWSQSPGLLFVALIWTVQIRLSTNLDIRYAALSSIMNHKRHVVNVCKLTVIWFILNWVYLTSLHLFVTT